MADTRITIRGLDPELYRWLRVESVKRQRTVGQMMNEAIHVMRHGVTEGYLEAVEKHAPARVEG